MTPTESSSATKPGRIVAIVMALMVVGAVVRWTFLDHPMRYDESYSYLHYGSHSPSHVMTHYTPNNHVLHSLLVVGVRRIIGDGPAALRIPAFVAGVLLIPAAAWLAWRISGSGAVAAWTALVICGSSALVEYSASARGYSMLALFATLAMGHTLALIEAPRRKRGWAAWGVLIALGACTVPVMVFPFVGLCAAVLAAGLRSRESRGELLVGLGIGVGVSGLVTAAFYLPILLSLGLNGLRQTEEMAYDVLTQQVASLGDVVTSSWELWVRHTPWGWSAILGVGLCGSAAAAVRIRGSRFLAPVLVVGGWLAVAGILRAPLPARTSLFALPLILSCGIAGLWGLARRGGYARVAAEILLTAVAGAPLVTVIRQERLCAEPNGLVEVEPAMDECRILGADRCAVVAPFTPATTYYRNQLGVGKLNAVTDSNTQRVYIVTSELQGLEDLWGTGTAGFEEYARPRLVRVLPTGLMYAAERVTTQCSVTPYG